jgi:hypothetical protein
VPAGQVCQAVQLGWLLPVVKPVVQSAHTRLLRSVPAAWTYLPGTQSAHGVQAVEFATVVKPVVQGVHTRLVVALPALLT